MERQEIFAKLTEIFQDVLDNDEIEVTADTKADDIEEWDSLSVVSYVAMANTSCGKKVNVKDVREAVTIRDLYNLLK